jgi:hypothetical protein
MFIKQTTRPRCWICWRPSWSSRGYTRTCSRGWRCSCPAPAAPCSASPRTASTRSHSWWQWRVSAVEAYKAITVTILRWCKGCIVQFSCSSKITKLCTDKYTGFAVSRGKTRRP